MVSLPISFGFLIFLFSIYIFTIFHIYFYYFPTFLSSLKQCQEIITTTTTAVINENYAAVVEYNEMPFRNLTSRYLESHTTPSCLLL